MKTLHWFGFFAAASRSAPRDRGGLTRLVDLLTRGATPVDGHDCPAKQQPEGNAVGNNRRNAEPVRWGNFR